MPDNIESVTQDQNQLAAIQELSRGAMLSSEDSDALVETPWLPRLQLCIDRSKPCQEQDFPVNHYGLVRGQSTEDLGETVDIIVLAERPKALDNNHPDGTLTVLDPQYEVGEDGKRHPSGEYARIMKDSFVKDSGCQYGPEYLIFIPKIEEFATLFMGSKSARIESKFVSGLAKKGKSITLDSQLLSGGGGKYRYKSPKAQICSAPLQLPDVAAVEAEIKKFKELKTENLATAEEKEKVARKR